METPKQQAIAANAIAIAQHQEAIRLAKQETWEIIAKQKAEAQEANRIIRQAIQEEQRVRAQQNEEMIHSSSIESQELSNPMSANAMEEGKTEDAPPPEEETAVWQIKMPPSLYETIAQMHSDAAQVRQQMQADIHQIMAQKFRT